MHTIAARFDKSVFVDGFKGYVPYMLEFRQQIRRMAAGTKVYGITRTHVAAVTLRTPPVEQQEVIAEALSDAHDLIESLERLGAKQELIRQGMMQQLLTGRIRLT
jgi:type I restriction enzyme S subunit